MMNNPRYGRFRFKFLFLPLIVLLFFGLSAVVQYLWNAVLPEAVHVGVLSYWQAAGLLALCRILFGGFHWRGRGGRPGFDGPPRHMREKWMTMTDEERAKFKEEFRERCRGYKRR